MSTAHINKLIKMLQRKTLGFELQPAFCPKGNGQKEMADQANSLSPLTLGKTASPRSKKFLERVY